MLLRLCTSKGIRLTAVTKGVYGCPTIVHVLRSAGIRSFGDSRIENIRRMRESGVDAEFLLLRPPMPSETARVVELADLSLNTELTVIRLLAAHAAGCGKVHRILLMVEMGDLREGILPCDIDSTVREIVDLRGVALVGIAANFACFAGASPSVENMRELSRIARRIQRSHGLTLDLVSGGNSANHQWLSSTADVGLVNNLRVGESILLGCDTLTRAAIPGLYTDAFTLVAEVIECRCKPSKSWGTIAHDAFGDVPVFEDRGSILRAILAVGRLDVDVSLIRPRMNATVLGACSDEMVLDVSACGAAVGDEIRFDVAYGALIRAMMSPYVEKSFLRDPRG